MIKEIITALALTAVAPGCVAQTPALADVAAHDVDEAAFLQLAHRLQALPLPQATAMVDSVMARAEARPQSVEQLLYWAEYYFFAPTSEMESEQLFAPFARAAVASAHTPLERKAAAEWQLEAIALNAPGTPATDFTMELADGSTPTLSAVRGSAPLLLFFYDPDCRSCQSVQRRLADLPQDAVRVLAVSVEAPHSRWEQTRGALPQWWIRAYDLDDVQAEGQYVFRGLPSIYLIGADGRVELKNPSIDQLTARLKP